ncbi:hypothetical protein SNEBB_003351 [Seison nebaliae]|nr:hypothetical protein SNEBB_003351 [Seison nebaliae]
MIWEPVIEEQSLQAVFFPLENKFFDLRGEINGVPEVVTEVLSDEIPKEDSEVLHEELPEEKSEGMTEKVPQTENDEDGKEKRINDAKPESSAITPEYLTKKRWKMTRKEMIQTKERKILTSDEWCCNEKCLFRWLHKGCVEVQGNIPGK